MTILVTIVHVLVCVFLVLVVLTQQGKGQDLASAFGGAGTQAAFGARGTATLLTKVTTGAAAIFMVTSLALGYLSPSTEEITVLEADAPETEPGDGSEESPLIEPVLEPVEEADGESSGEAGEEPAEESGEEPSPEPRPEPS